MKIFILLLALGLCLADAVPGGYQPIDVTEAQADPTIQSYIQTGLNAVVQNAINKGFFSNSDFTLVSINSVAEQVVNGANYKFDCNFTDSTGVVIEATFVIYQSATTNATTVTSYAYKVYYPATTITTTTTTTTPTEEDNSAVAEESAESGESTETTPTESGEADTTTTTTTVNGQANNNSTTETSTTTTTDAATNNTETSTEASVNSTTPATNETTVVSPDGFTAISAAEFSQSDDLRKYFTFGFENVVQNGINSGKIPNTTFSAAKVLGASYKTLKNGELYKFTAEASNGDNVDLELGFEVSIKVPAYTYRVKVTTTVPANNTSDDNSTTPVDTGAGSGSGSDNNTTTPVDTGAGSGSNNNSTTPVDTGAGSGSGSDNNTTTPVDTGAGSGSDNNSTTTPVDTGAGSGSDNNSTTTPVDTGAGSGSDNNNSTTPVDTNTNTTANTTSPSEDEWIAIDPAQVQQSAELQSNLAQGFNQVIQTVVQKKLLAADNYTVTQVVAISYHNLTKGVNYKFTVKANNDAQTFFLDMNFTTYYRYSNQSVKTVSYHYNYYTKAAPAGQNNTSNTTTPAQNNTTPAQNNTTPAQNTTNSTNGYVALSADEIQAQDVQNAINYGSDQVVQTGIQKGKIPSDTYNITQVASVLKKIQPSGANYNATVTLQSAANVTVTTNFNVYYNSASNNMVLKAYSYGVSGIKKNNGNSTKN